MLAAILFSLFACSLASASSLDLGSSSKETAAGDHDGHQDRFYNMGMGGGMGRGGTGGSFSGGMGRGPVGGGAWGRGPIGGGGWGRGNFGPGPVYNPYPNQMAAGGPDADGIDYGAEELRRKRLREGLGHSPRWWNPLSWPDYFRKKPPEDGAPPTPPPSPSAPPSPAPPSDPGGSGGQATGGGSAV